MNLDDYAYNQDDRWYVNPQVALEEQNAFINNLRNLQGKDTAQIQQQTYGLGTQIPSQLGGLGGGSGYFKARFQTPQINQTIASLRSAAQAQALNTSLANEIAKKQKQYKDAYRAASVRNTNKDNQTPLFEDLESKLKINVEGSIPTDKMPVSEDVVKPGEIGVDEQGRTYVLGENGERRQLTEPSQGEALMINPGGWAQQKPLPNGHLYTNPVNGRTYYYDAVNDIWYVYGEVIND